MRATPDESARPPAVGRASYREMSLYEPDAGLLPAAVSLADNTNGWGMCPAAARALAAAATEGIASSYPSPYGDDLKAALAGHLSVAPESIVTGCGSDGVLDPAIRAFGTPGARIAFPVPTFSMIPALARANGVEAVPVPLRADLDLDADAILATGAEIVYLCSPNNPTGTPVSSTALERVLARAPGLVILDEAYIEFGGASLTARAPALGNVLVVRTFSKAFGLAGLRVGYGVGAPAIVAAVEKARGPYTVNAFAERAAVAAVTAGLEWAASHARLAVEVRERLAGRLRALGLLPIPSAANFVLVPIPSQPGALEIARRMRQAGVAVRPFAALHVIGDALRISVGPWPLVERALAALEMALGAESGA